jgi:hypothetical protein
MPNYIDPVRVLDPFNDHHPPGPHTTAQIRRRSENDAAAISSQHTSMQQQEQQQPTGGPQRSNSNRGLRRGWSADHFPQHKKKNLVQKGLAFLLESTASVARHPSAAGATLPASNMPPPQHASPTSSSSALPPATRWSPNNQQQQQQQHHQDDDDDDDDLHADYDDNEDEPNITTYYTTSSDRLLDQEHHGAVRRDRSSESPVPQVQNVDTYESEFSGYSSPLADHEFKILPNNNNGNNPILHQALPQQEEPTLLIIEETDPPLACPRRVQKIKPKVSTPRDSSKTQPRRNHQRHRNRQQQPATATHRNRHHHQHHPTGSSSASASAAVAAGVAVGTFTRFLCGAIPTACGASDGGGGRSERQRKHDDEDNGPLQQEDDRQSRLRNLFQPLRDKVRMHFSQNFYEDDDDPSLDRSFLTATTASTRRRQRNPASSRTSTSPAKASAAAFFHKYLDFVDAIGLASSTAEDDETLTTLGGRTDHSRFSELTPYPYGASATNTTTAESAATAEESVVTGKEKEEEYEEPDESLYSVEMTYHDQDEEKGNEPLQQEVQVVPSMTASSGSISSSSSSSSPSDAESEDNDHDNDEAETDGDDDSGITASDESVLSRVSDQMTIEDADSEESIIYSARVSLDHDGDDVDDIYNNITMVDDKNNMSVELGGDSTLVNINNIRRQESSVEYEGIEYTVKVTPPRISSHRDHDELFGITHNISNNSSQSSSSSYKTMDHAAELQLDHTWIEHDEQGPLFSSNTTLASTATITSYYDGSGSFKDEDAGTSSSTRIEEQIEAVFCTKKWLSGEDDDQCQCEQEIVFTDLFTEATAVREIDGEYYETTSDFSSVVVDHVYGLI